MLYHAPLQTYQKEVSQTGGGTEAQKCDCSPPLNKENMPKRGRMHHFSSLLSLVGECINGGKGSKMIYVEALTTGWPSGHLVTMKKKNKT